MNWKNRVYCEKWIDCVKGDYCPNALNSNIVELAKNNNFNLTIGEYIGCYEVWCGCKTKIS